MLKLRVTDVRSKADRVAKRVDCFYDSEIVKARQEKMVLGAMLGRTPHIVKLVACLTLPEHEVFILECAPSSPSPFCNLPRILTEG